MLGLCRGVPVKLETGSMHSVCDVEHHGMAAWQRHVTVTVTVTVTGYLFKCSVYQVTLHVLCIK
jgi:hypothetical protein